MTSWEHVTEPAEDSIPFTEEEDEIMNALKEHVGEEGLKQLSHESLVRYVRGYAFEAKTGGKEKWREVACAEASKTISWRKEIDANTLELRKLPLWDVFEASWVTGVFGTDNQGHPIIVERFQDFKLDRILSMFKPEDLAMYQARNLENVQRRKEKISEKLGKLIYKHVYILDCTGLGMDVLKSRAHIQAIFHVAQYYYPETLYRMFIVNAPMVFRMIWTAASPLIHPITRQKVKVLAGKALKDFKANGIDESQIPASIGGKWKPDPKFDAELAEQLAKLTAQFQQKNDSSAAKDTPSLGKSDAGPSAPVNAAAGAAK